MSQVDAKAGHVDAVTANFEQQKFTPMLRKPLVSTGHVTTKGAASLWVTDAPQPTRMLVTATEIQIYYPAQSVVESYPVQGRLGALAASPLPRLEVLKQFFTFEKINAAALDPAATDAAFLALRLTPSTDELRQHVRQVRVLLDRATGTVARAETVDTDGDRTLLSFTGVRVNPAVIDADVRLDVPAGARQVRPLDAAGGPAADGR